MLLAVPKTSRVSASSAATGFLSGGNVARARSIQSTTTQPRGVFVLKAST